MEAWTEEEERFLIEYKTKGMEDVTIANKIPGKYIKDVREHWIEMQQERPQLVGLDRFTYKENQIINYLNTERYTKQKRHKYGPEDIAEELGVTVEEVLERAEILHQIGFRRPGCNHSYTDAQKCPCWDCRDDLFKTCPWILRHNVVAGMKFADGLKPGDKGYIVSCTRFRGDAECV